MSDKMEKISQGFETAFREAGDVSVDTDVESQQRTRRRRELDSWSVESGRQIAESEGLELNEERLAVVECLRTDYLEHGPAESGRQLSDMLDERFSEAGGRAYLRRLFPEGPVTQAVKIGGLPLPGDTEDEGFGTAW